MTVEKALEKLAEIYWDKVAREIYKFLEEK